MTHLVDSRTFDYWFWSKVPCMVFHFGIGKGSKISCMTLLFPELCVRFFFLSIMSKVQCIHIGCDWKGEVSIQHYGCFINSVRRSLLILYIWSSKMALENTMLLRMNHTPLPFVHRHFFMWLQTDFKLFMVHRTCANICAQSAMRLATLLMGMQCQQTPQNVYF